MSTITPAATVKNKTYTTKFDSLTFSKNGLILKYSNEPEIEIPFAEFDQIYIKKHQLNPFVEFICIVFPFLLVFMSIQYLPFDLMILVSIVSILPVFMRIINYKWYRLYVRLNDGTSFRKKITTYKKTQDFSILEKVRTEYICYKFNDNLLATA